MPLKSGKSKKVISENIGEMMHDVKSGDGMIGNVKPKSMEHASKVAAAVAYSKARKSTRGAKRLFGKKGK